MTRKLPVRRSNCPIACALEIIGDKWTLVVLRDLMMGRKCYFKDLLASEEGIATNILTSRLKRLEVAGLVTQRADPRQSRRRIYEPTEKALDLLPVLIELVHWNMKHDPKSVVPARFARRLAEDREGFIAELRAAHRGA
jgi:DNA-binding HxlR family transcriptional regulator